jgi:hypothetical protein
MRPDSAARLGAGFAALRPVWVTAPPSLDKRYYEAVEHGRASVPGRLPLAGVFLLAPRNGTVRPEVRPMTPGELLPVLLANRHTASVLDRAGHRRDFAFLGALVRCVPGRELVRPDNLGAVPDVVATVLTEAEKWRF